MLENHVDMMYLRGVVIRLPILFGHSETLCTMIVLATLILVMLLVMGYRQLTEA